MEIIDDRGQLIKWPDPHAFVPGEDGKCVACYSAGGVPWHDPTWAARMAAKHEKQVGKIRKRHNQFGTLMKFELELLARIEDFRFQAGISSRLAAIRWLLEWALDQKPVYDGGKEGGE